MRQGSGELVGLRGDGFQTAKKPQFLPAVSSLKTARGFGCIFDKAPAVTYHPASLI